MNHIAEHELAIFAFDASRCSRRSEIEKHLASCDSCRLIVEFMQVTDQDLSAPDTWESSDESPTLSSLRTLAKQVSDEDAAAEELLKPLLRAPVAAAWAQIESRKAFRTGGVVRKLTAHALAQCEIEPLDALTFSEAAVSVAEALPADTYPANAVHELRGAAWKARANALRYLGRPAEALESLQRAERAYSKLVSSAFGIAAVQLQRGVVLSELERYDEAAVLAGSAAKAFAHLGEDERHTQALHLTASIRYEQRRLEEATTLFERVRDYAEAQDDATWMARSAQALGSCWLDRGDLGQASMELHKALALFRDLGLKTEVVRTEWTIARVLLQAGHAPIAVRRLYETVRAFEKAGMVTDAALAGLDLAEGLLATNEAAKIAELATWLFRIFTDAKMLTGALTAIAFLRETAASGTLTQNDLDSIRSFLPRAERQPHLLFVPPR